VTGSAHEEDLRPPDPGFAAADSADGLDDLAATPAIATPAGATAEFDAFVAARYSALVRTAYLLTHDGALAEDLVQTALAKSWPKWRRVHTAPEAYVRKVMVNTFATWWRRRWRGERPTDDLPERPADTGDPDGGERPDLWSALRRLPPRQRAVLVLRYYDDLTETETATLLDCSVGTVKSQASKALAKLRLDPGLRTDGPRDEPEGGRR